MRIVALCGSTKFRDIFHAEAERLTLEGWIVVMPHVFSHATGKEIAPHEKTLLDRLHLDKIRLADRVHIINPGGYVGPSTSNELLFAVKRGKQITYFDPVGHVD